MSINALTRAGTLYKLPGFLKDFKKQEIGNDEANQDCFLKPSSGIAPGDHPERFGIGGPFTDLSGKAVSMSVSMATTAYCYEQKKGVSYRRNRDALLDLCRYLRFYDPATGEPLPEPNDEEAIALGLRNWLLELRDRCAELGVYEQGAGGEDYLPFSLPAFSNRIVPEELAAEACLTDKLSDMNVSSLSDSTGGILLRIDEAVSQQIKDKLIGEKDRNDVKLFLFRLALEYIRAMKKIRERLKAVYDEKYQAADTFIRLPLEGYKLEYRESIVELLTVRHLFTDLLRVRSNGIGGISYRFFLGKKELSKNDSSAAKHTDISSGLAAAVKRCDTGFNQSLRSFWGIQIPDVNRALKTMGQQGAFFDITEKSDSFTIIKEVSEEDARKFFFAYCMKAGLYPNPGCGVIARPESEEKIRLFNSKARYAARLTTLLRIMSDQRASADKKEAILFRTASWIRISDGYLSFERELLKELVKTVLASGLTVGTC